MKPIRRELLNDLFVLVVGSLISTAFEAFHVNFDIRLWALIVMGVAIAVSGYTVFAIALGFMAATEDREPAAAESTRLREEEWLKRVVLRRNSKRTQ
jgi:hypothetical protein